MISFLLCLALLIIGYFVYGKMLPRNTRKEFLSRSRQIFLIPRQRPFPEPVKAAAAKLSSLFLCKLLNHL